MNRERLIKQLVEKMASKNQAGFGCVPCFGMKMDALRQQALRSASKR